MGRGKYTEQEALYALPEPTADDNRDQPTIEPNNSEWFTTLAQLPPRFRSVVWIKRGSYVLVDLSEQLTDKIGGEIAMVMMATQIKHLRQIEQWPTHYEDMWDGMLGKSAGAAQPGTVKSECGSEDEDEDMDDLMGGRNPNRQYIGGNDDSSSEDEDEDEDEDDE
ncbi:hypothetical protein BX661DRAFT_225468 [Kickxella alabastrina]|uniref:uncharacterized protein n=1 Tax=Kickxella alabastrina TaxID=61397 RepID=UPI00221EF0FB|nr:uncharacterized protein BX661DRAFT_225468 [Kickxella alabastrina]KAI7825550.1 hypothetical protein BX661DRAFT_225468 [Kickxella alabastrina]